MKSFATVSRKQIPKIFEKNGQGKFFLEEIFATVRASSKFFAQNSTCELDALSLKF